MPQSVLHFPSDPKALQPASSPGASPSTTSSLQGPKRLAWRILQTSSWMIGASIFAGLLVLPEIGLHAFWNVLIPIVPALFVFAPGLWRNVCPLGSTALFPGHIGFSPRLRLSSKWQTWLNLIGVILLFLVMPFRHVLLNASGFATATTLMLIAIGALVLGWLFEGKSGWCSGACPVFQVEKLYGSDPALTVQNAHCSHCERCVSPCTDSVTTPYPFPDYRDSLRNLVPLLMLGAFPGYLWGWFHVPDYTAGEGWQHLDLVFGYPLLGAGVTLLAFLGLQKALPRRFHASLMKGFAAGTVSCYYWYRIPALVGLGLFPGDGMLINLAFSLPDWFESASRMATTGLFFWWFFRLKEKQRAWMVRPVFAKRISGSPEGIILKK